MSEQNKKVGVNWSNCPYWEQCEDGNKHIMTYCDVQCPTPAKKKRLDRPELREKMIWFIREGQYLPEYRHTHLADYFLSLIPDIEEAKKQVFRDRPIKDEVCHLTWDMWQALKKESHPGLMTSKDLDGDYTFHKIGVSQFLPPKKEV